MLLFTISLFNIIKKASCSFNPFSTDQPLLINRSAVQVGMTTLLPIIVHSALISGPIDSKPSANERIKFEIQ
jgi:hypothetical protein